MMPGGGEPGGGNRRVVYCLVPRELSARLHEALRRHFREDPEVEVVVERRGVERRGPTRRIDAAAMGGTDRRRVRNAGARRVAERRAVVVDIDLPRLPRQAVRHADRLRFVERFEPASEYAEDIDTARRVIRFQAGDREAFTAVYLRYFDRVYRYLQLLIGDSHEAEDVTQLVFMRTFEALPRYERREKPFRAWLFTIARNQALTSLRKTGRTDVLEPEELTRHSDAHPASHPDDPSALTWISDRELTLFVERLPLPQRQVLLLRYMMGMTNPEIAEALGRSPEGVRKLHSRALAYLEGRLRAVGREMPRTRSADSRVFLRQVHVLRARRFALITPG